MPRQNNAQNGSSVYFKLCHLHFRTFSFVTTHNISETACPPQYVKFILIFLFFDCKWEDKTFLTEW